MNIPRFAVKYPISISMLFFGIILLGVISLNELGTELLPDIASPKINIRVEAGEKPPEEMERKYTKRVESFVSQLNGVKRVSSTSMTGISVVTIEYNWDTDMDFALLDVQKAVAGFSGDREVQSVSVDRFDPRTAPIMTLCVTPKTDRDLDAVRNDVERVVKLRLERLDGVAAAVHSGGRKKEIVIQLKPYHLMAYGLEPRDVISKIQSTNINQSGGEVKDNEKVYIVKGIGEFQDITELKTLVVGYKRNTVLGANDRQDGGQAQQQNAPQGSLVPVQLIEVADVEFKDREVDSIVRFNGKEGVGISIYREAQSNTVTTSAKVHETLEDLRRDLAEVDIDVSKDQADFINSSISEVEFAAFIGMILAIMVLTVFLRNLWATFIVALSIPISIVATFNLMYFSDLTLNIMTLGGLALGAGMLVDNSIVVMENIFRHRNIGKSAKEAAISGTGEVGTAIFASTITTVSVFMPIVYVKGIGAELFKEQAFTVAFSLLSSLLVAFLLIPMLASRLMKSKPSGEYKKIRSKLYYGLLNGALKNKWIVIAVTVFLAVLTIQSVGLIGTEFMPRSDQMQFSIKIRFPEGTQIEKTSNVARVIENLILHENESKEFIESVYSEIGYQGDDNFYIDFERGLNTAQIFVRMKKYEDKYLPTSRFVQAIQPAIENIPEMQAEFINQESALEQSLGDLAGGIVVLVKGPELDVLESISSRLLGEIEQIDGLFNAKTSFRTGRPEINISLDRTIAAGLDITMDQIITAVRNRISESLAGEFHYEGDDRDIRVAFPKISQRELENIRITTGQGAVITLKNVAEFKLISSPKEILREEQVRVGLVTADIKDDAKYIDVINQINSKIASITLPRDYNITISGEERERQQSFSELRFALILAVILVYMVLASLFESFIHPFTIMLAVPMAGIGSVLIFLIIGKPLSIMAFIGIIMLAGIAVNDAIIFVDYINTLRSKGKNRIDAIMQAGQDRLRPIIMTSLTTILALVPLVIGIGEGASLRAPLAYAVIGGLTTSTLMTLILTPCLYLVLDNLRPKRFREQTVPVNTD